MKNKEKYPQIIENILSNYIVVIDKYSELKSQVIVNDNLQEYLLVIFGGEGYPQIHECVIHLEIVGEKIKIIRDVIQDGIAQDLIDAGIPKERIFYLSKPTSFYTKYTINLKRLYEQNKTIFISESNFKKPKIKPHTTSAELIKLSKIDYGYIIREIAKHPNTSIALLIKIFPRFPLEVLANPILDLLLFEDPKLFEKFYDRFPNIFERKEFKIPDFFIEWAINQEREDIRASIATSHKITISFIERLLNDKSCYVIQKLYSNNRLLLKTKEQLNIKRLQLEEACPHKEKNKNCDPCAWDEIPF